jgi:hypothetical protein
MGLLPFLVQPKTEIASSPYMQYQGVSSKIGCLRVSIMCLRVQHVFLWAVVSVSYQHVFLWTVVSVSYQHVFLWTVVSVSYQHVFLWAVVSVSYQHVFLWTVVSVSYHYKNKLTNLVGYNIDIVIIFSKGNLFSP